MSPATSRNRSQQHRLLQPRCLQPRCLQPRRGIHAWTLGELASQEPTLETARIVLDDVAARLERQASAMDDLSSSYANATVQSQLSFLRHVHVDTAQQCRHVLQQSSLWSTTTDDWPMASQTTIRHTLEAVRDRHAPSLERWVDVALALSESDQALDVIQHLLQGRLSILLLAHHYVQLTQHVGSNKRRRPTGAVAQNVGLADVVHEAYTEASFLCQAHYQRSPELNMANMPDSLTVTGVRSWLNHILVEVCKNAMSATIQQHEIRHGAILERVDDYDDDDDDDDGGVPLPSLVVTACIETGTDTLILDLRDYGVGLPSSLSSDPFAWGTSSAGTRWDRLAEQQSYAAVRPPLASLGVGLPASRTMLRHFGGDLQLLPAVDGDGQQPEGTIARLVVPQTTNRPETLPLHFRD